MTTRRAQAGLPTERELRRITLEAMRSISLPASNDEINTAVADLLGLTSDQRSFMHSNGSQTEVAYSTAWARTALKTAGAAENVGRALWTLTDEGRHISPETVNHRYENYLEQLKGVRTKTTAPGDPESAPNAPVAPPEQGSTEELDWRQTLLAHLLQMSPQGFEHLSGALLEAAGFHDVAVTRQTADGGIDVVAVYRPQGLISFRTTVQCKRWSGSVGADRVQAFQGASMGKADRGILITTGQFTPAAQAQAKSPGAFPIDLIDGEALCELLKEYSLGVRVTRRTVEDILIDETYFNQFDRSPDSDQEQPR